MTHVHAQSKSGLSDEKILANLVANKNLEGWSVYVAPLPAPLFSAQTKESAAPIVRAAPLLEFNSTIPRNPASLTKLVTTAAALEILGPAYTFKTEVWQQGDTIFFRGGGDPFLVIEQFWLLLRRLHATTGGQIGDIVLDRTRFESLASNEEPFDGEVERAYNTNPQPLLLNFHSLTLRLTPLDNELKVDLLPPIDGLVIDPIPIVQSAGSGCRNWRDKLGAQLLSGNPNRISFRGAFDLACGEKLLTLNAHILSSDDYFASVFKSMWRELGGQWQGNIRSGVVPSNAKFLFAFESPPIVTLVRSINKFSNNVMAQQLLANLPLIDSVGPSSEALGRDSALRWLRLIGMETKDFYVENGSGLSRQTRMSAAQLAWVLQHMFYQPVMPEFLTSLPRIGIDGTMRSRLKNTSVVGQGYIKTGSLNSVSAVAGFLQSQSGKWFAVVSILNDPSANQNTFWHDRLLAWVYTQ